MTKDTLVLNKNYYAIHISPWEKAMSLIYQGAAQVIDENMTPYSFDDWVQLSSMMKTNDKGFVHTSTMRIAVPEVIRLTKYDRLPKQEVKFTRQNIYEHYGLKCSYCGNKFTTKELNLDHIIPRSRGGKTNWENIVLSCIPCNSRKDCKTPAEAGMALLVKPARPRWRGVKKSIVERAPVPIPVSWQRLIDDKYWLTELENG